MPGLLVNNTLSSLSGGVTQQYQEGRFDSQVSSMDNCIPSITRGVLRRNPVNYVDTISTTDLINSFVYTYDRGTGDEQYMAVIPGTGVIRVYNINTGLLLYTSASSDYLKTPVGSLSKDIFKALTIGDHTFIVNTTIQTAYTIDVGSSSGYSNMAFYWIKKTTSVVTNQEQDPGATSADPIAVGSRLEGYEYNLNTYTVQGLIETRPSETPVDLGSASKIAIEMATNDTAWTAEDSIVYTTQTDLTGWDWSDSFGDEASIGVWKDVNSSDKLPANLPSDLDGFLVKVSGGTSAEFDDYYLKYSHTEKTWKETVKPGVNTTLDPTTMPHVLYREADGDFFFTTYQSIGYYNKVTEAGGALATGSWIDQSTGPVTTAPYLLLDGPFLYNYMTIVEGKKYTITIDLSSETDSGVFIFDNNDDEYTLKPGEINVIEFEYAGTSDIHIRAGINNLTIDNITMTSEDFGFTGISLWGDRESGGGDELQDPSFIGTTLNDIFFFKNRLGLLTKDNIILSQTGGYGDFFVQTIQNVLDDDPIDLAVASTDVTILRHAVPTSGQLILFADDTQFSLRSLEGPLTPNTADITAISNYTYSNDAPAVAIGNRVLFSNKAGSYSQIYSYKVTDRGSQITEASPMTLHLPSFISNNLVNIVGHDVLGLTFFQESDSKKRLIVLSSVSKGNEDLQNAFHTWTFRDNIVSTHIVNNNLYIVFETGAIGNINLDVPGSIDDVTYLDAYDSGGVHDDEYTSSMEFSRFTMRDTTGKGTVRGRYQIRTLQYTITDESRYITNIVSTNQSILDPLTMMGPTWVDTETWDDTKIWIDTDPLYSRDYVDDDKVTVMSDSKNVTITFKSSALEPGKGFELATANIEALFHQRSTRR